MSSRLLSAKIIEQHPVKRDLTGLTDEGEKFSLVYRLKRHAQSRRLTLRLLDDEVVVTAPVWAPLTTIDRFVFDQWEWLQNKKKTISDASPFPLSFPFRGGLVRIELNATAAAWRQLSETLWVLRVPVSESACPKAIRQEVGTLLRLEARRVLGERFEQIQKKVSQKATCWRLSSARGRWGSCNPRLKSINLAWRLVGCSDEVIDYVIAHELAHLREANHSEKFWREVEKIDPLYREHERRIKQIRSEMFPGL